MKENSIKNERISIEEDIKIALDKFSDNKDIDSAILIVEKFILGNYILRGGRKNIVKDSLRYILQDYKRVLKENEKLKKKIDLMENYMVENGWEICFDNIYAELNNCNGMERDWCRGDELEKQDIHKYFSKKLLESEE